MRHILYFTAEWCNPCKRVRPIAEELDRDGIIKFQYVDADDNIDLCKQFEIKAIPTFILIEDNKEVRRINGAKTREQLEDFINGSN
jgi:thioredoxin-like negative regulator of GroEL